MNVAKNLAGNTGHVLRREDYKKVKKMDRTQFEGFCKSLYMEGYRDGKNSVPGIDVSQVKEAIAVTKGIGESRLQAIMENIENQFGGKESGR